jgi:hypothetical protein
MIWGRIGIAILALLATSLFTMLLVQILLTCYTLDINPPINKEIFILLTAGEFTFFYHWMMKLSK